MREQIEMPIKKEKIFEEIKKQALDLLEAHKSELYASHDEDLMDYIAEIPDEVRKKYWGHGITRGNTEDRLISLICALETESVAGYEGNLGAGSYSAWVGGPAMIISKPDKELMIKKDNKLIEREIKINDGNIIKASKVDIGLVVLNDQFYSLWDDLKKMYPHIKIIKANQLPDELK